MSHLLRLLVILPALALILPVSAQEDAKQTRTIRILFLNAPQDAPVRVHLHDGRASQEVDLPRMNLSVPYEVPAGLLNLRLLAAPVEQPELVPPDAPAVLIPESMGDVYLLCLPDPANPLVPVSMEVIDASKDKFRIGQMLWRNLTPFTVEGTLGEGQVMLKPHDKALVDAPVTGRESYPVNISYTIAEDERVRPICQTNWMHDPLSRQLVFVFTENERSVPRILGFTDFRPPHPEKAP